MTSHPKYGPRVPARGYKKKIAKLQAVADAADVVMHHYADSHWQESSFRQMLDAMEPLRLALIAAGYGSPLVEKKP